jgi:RNA polymerase sigma-70 factor (ECF subfamily)
VTREEEFQLIERVKNGDRNAFEDLVNENQKQVYNLALRMVGNEFDALDVAQEAFLKA